MKIAVVDDEKYVRKLLVRSLKRDKHIVDSFEGGSDFLEKRAAGARYDLILLDIVMPGMNGIEVYETLKTSPVSMPAVIFISAYDFTGNMKHIVDNSSVWYLPKPFGMEELRAGIKRTGAFVQRRQRYQSAEVIQLKEHSLLCSVSHDTIPPM